MSSNANDSTPFEEFIKKVKSAPNLTTLTIRIRNEFTDIFRVEMATIFMVDAANKLLVSWILMPGESLRKICIPITKSSISGYVAACGKKLMIRDVYNSAELMEIDSELKFDSSWDRKTGNRTRQILAVPISTGKSVIGVLQLINKRHNGNFIDTDEKNCEELASILGRIIYKLRKSTIEKKSYKFDKLISDGVISKEDFNKAILRAQQDKKDVELVLIEDYHLAKDQLGKAVADFYNTNFVDLTLVEYDTKDFLKGINIDYFRKFRLIPLKIEDNKVVLASDNPYDQSKVPEVMQVLRASQAEVLFSFGFDIENYIDKLKGVSGQQETSSGSIADIIEKITEDDQETQVDQYKIESELTDSRPIVMLVRKIIEDAYEINASDIHIEPYGLEKDAEVRFRVDGVCKNVLTIPKGHIRPVLARFKVLADLDIAERRKPQDGKIKFRTSEGKDIELRVATLPTADGNEDMVLRVLADSKPLPLEQIMPENIFTPFKKIVKKPYGIILVVGPTGSGKTTTLHSALSYINTPEKKIWTAEDPVEITQYRLRQVQVRPKIGLTFATAMRAFLRADPDVIMVGEMRDQETARMGIEASLTGHLVLSTLHTNSAAETVTRLLDMGIDTFNFADSLQGILAQRLVRTLCPKCKEAYNPTREEFEHLLENYGVFFFDHLHTTYSDKLILYRTTGCKHCNNTGYKGRIGVFELLIANRSLRKHIIERAPVDIIKQDAINEGMTTLIQEGIRLIFDGKTDFNQVMSVCAL